MIDLRALQVRVIGEPRHHAVNLTGYARALGNDRRDRILERIEDHVRIVPEECRAMAPGSTMRSNPSSNTFAPLVMPMKHCSGSGPHAVTWAEAVLTRLGPRLKQSGIKPACTMRRNWRI